ncbi:MAG: hypothetical protein FWC43_07575 [Planctomycetaceae bacterium]|nr:hypothetical protein [Planctomycetaceae bacterium]MCL2305186.1 hypothetical protein [Planctomycetaceae bacterium]
MEQIIESATEYYALLFEDEGELNDIDDYIDKEDRIIELAVGAVYIGELTDKQFHNFLWRYKQESKIREFKYTVEFIDRSSIPSRKEMELEMRFVVLTTDRQEMLDTALQLADAARKPNDKNKPIKPKTKSVTDSNTQQPAKQPRKPRGSKYEDGVKYYLIQFSESVLEGIISPKEVEKLSPKSVAENFKKLDKFKNAQIENIEDRVGRTKAWKNRMEILRPIYNTKTFNNPLSRETPLPSSVNVVKENRSEQFEVPVEAFLNKIRCETNTREMYLSTLEKLSPEDMAECFKKQHEQFKDKSIESITKGIKFSEAWKNRKQY